jgi:sodium-dependent phosphate transporter
VRAGNAFGTSVGSRTLTMKQAVIVRAPEMAIAARLRADASALFMTLPQIAIVFEFAGALVLGRVITETIAGSIADPSIFAREPEVFAYGSACPR